MPSRGEWSLSTALATISWGMIPTLGWYSGRYLVCFVCLVVWFIWLVNQINQINQTNETNQINQQTSYKEGAAAPGMTEPGLPWR